MKSSVLVVGSVAFDAIETPFEKRDRVMGGSAAYASLASSYFAPTKLVGVVGDDFSEEDMGRLSRRGIDLEGLQRDPTGKTFFWSGVYGENFQSCATTRIELNVFEKFTPRLPVSYQKTPFVLLGNIHPALQIHVLDQMEERAFVIADTRDLWIENTPGELLSLLPRLDLLVLNDEESLLLTNQSNLILAGRALREMGPERVIVKKGQHGSLLFHPGGLFALPAYPVVDLRDPTGAGDTYAGALAGYMASVGDSGLEALKAGMLHGTAAASLTVEGFGPDRLEEAGREIIEERRHELLAMTRIEFP